jgi:hypothetical protein
MIPASHILIVGQRELLTLDSAIAIDTVSSSFSVPLL